MALAELQPGIALPQRQSCAAGDAISLVVVQLPPSADADRDTLRADVDAVFDNGHRHRVGTLLAHPRPTSGARVLGTACVPGARGYYVTWHLDSSRDLSAQVGLQQSIGGADYGIRNFDLADAEPSLSSWLGSGGYATASLLSPTACVAAEIYGHSRGADAIIQLFDAATLNPGDACVDEWFVPAGGTFHRALPPRIFSRGLIVARSLTVGTWTAEPTGDHTVRARILLR